MWLSDYCSKIEKDRDISRLDMDFLAIWVFWLYGTWIRRNKAEALKQHPQMPVNTQPFWYVQVSFINTEKGHFYSQAWRVGGVLISHEKINPSLQFSFQQLPFLPLRKRTANTVFLICLTRSQ